MSDAVRLNRTMFSQEWEVVRLGKDGIIVQRWPLHPDDAAQLEAVWLSIRGGEHAPTEDA